MCAMDRSATDHLPLRALILLGTCVCILSMHYVAEGLASGVNQSVIEVIYHGDHSHSSHEQYEDHFVFPVLNHLQLESLHKPLVSQEALNSSSFSVSPPLPPPDL
jgi:hypothetical protein